MNKDDINNVETWKEVNACKTLTDLANVIKSLADEHNNIKISNGAMDVNMMASVCMGVNSANKSMLTRRFGIRRQAIYIAVKQRGSKGL